MIRYLLTGLLFLANLSQGSGQDTTYYEHLLIADSLIAKQDIQKCKYNILKGKAKYQGNDKGVLQGIAFREQFVRNFTEGERPDSIVIAAAEQIMRNAVDQSFSNRAKVNYGKYFVEALIQEKKEKEYILKIVDLTLQFFKSDYGSEEPLDSLSLLYLMNNKGETLSYLSQFQQAEVELKSAIKILERQASKDSILWVVLLYNLADAVYYAGDEVRAFKILEESENIHYQIAKPNIDYLSTTYSELATYYTRLGYYDKAKFFLDRSYAIFKKYPKEILAIKAKNEAEMELFYCYQFLYLLGNKSGYEHEEGDLEMVLENLRKAENFFEQVSRKKSNRVVMAAVYNYAGEFYVDRPYRDQKLKSIQYYDKAARALNDPTEYNYALQYSFNKSKAFLNIGQFAKCIATIDKVIQSGESIKDSRLPYFYTMKAHALLRQGNLQESLLMYEKVFNMIDQNEETLSLLEDLDPILYKSNGGLVDAFLIGGSGSYINDSIAGNETTWTAALNMMNFGMKQFMENFEENKINKYIKGEYEKLLLGIFELQNKLNRHNFSKEELLSMSENVKAKYLWQKFKENNSEVEFIDRDLLAAEQAQTERITLLKKQFLDSNADSVQRQIQTAQFELEKLEEKKKQLYPSFVKYDEVQFDVSSFQATIPTGIVIIKYEQAKDQLLKFEISRDHLEFYSLGSFEPIKTKINTLIGASRKPNSKMNSIENAGEELYEILIGKTLIGDHEIVVVADDLLSNVPFDLLKKDGRFLFESNLISYAPSLLLLNFNDNEKQIADIGVFAPSYETYSLSPQQIAVRGAAYNLEGALEEAASISELLATELYTREEASKSAFVENAKEFDVLHLSMHSFLNDDDPELSSLVFTDKDADNELYISELYGMDLDASLAVLSACNTGVGKEKTGEGVVSMTRAFTYAGIPSIVSSLWSAPDQATRQIMTTFYTELKAGKSKSEALRQAKLTYIDNQEVEALKHPYFWAGFVLHGNTNALEFKNSRRKEKIVLFGLVLFGLVSMIILVKRRKAKAA